jgi:hypothetical protein
MRFTSSPGRRIAGDRPLTASVIRAAEKTLPSSASSEFIRRIPVKTGRWIATVCRRGTMIDQFAVRIMALLTTLGAVACMSTVQAQNIDCRFFKVTTSGLNAFVQPRGDAKHHGTVMVFHFCDMIRSCLSAAASPVPSPSRKRTRASSRSRLYFLQVLARAFFRGVFRSLFLRRPATNICLEVLL